MPETYLKLRVCPFCGDRGDLEYTEPRDGQRTLYWVECRGDECGVNGRICETPETAAAAWNRRATDGVKGLEK